MSSTDDTVIFTSGNMYLSEYVPEVSDFGEDVRERALVGFTSTLTTIRANIQLINNLFEQARNYGRTATGKRVYIEFDPDTSGTLYRSPVRSGRVNMTEDVLGNQWGAANLELEIEWTRAGYWEGPLTQLPLTNSNDTDNTSGLTVNNAFDTTHDNTFRISSTDIIGDLPAPIKLQAVNATTDSDAADEIFLFHNVYSTPASFVHIVQGESSTAAASTSTTDANSSADNYTSMAWASTSETLIGDWTIPSSDLTDAAGGRFAVLARWADISHYTDTWLRLKLETAVNFNDLWVGNLSLLSTTTDTRELTWLDTLRLPPYLENQTSLASLQLRLYGLGTSDTHTLNLDYLQLSPISGESGWKRFKSVDRGILAEETFIHDDTEGFTYRINSSTNKIAEFISYGGPILLVPNVTQKLYLLSCDYTGEALINQNWTVKLWYRPRRNSL